MSKYEKMASDILSFEVGDGQSCKIANQKIAPITSNMALLVNTFYETGLSRCSIFSVDNVSYLDVKNMRPLPDYFFNEQAKIDEIDQIIKERIKAVSWEGEEKSQKEIIEIANKIFNEVSSKKDKDNFYQNIGFLENDSLNGHIYFCCILSNKKAGVLPGLDRQSYHEENGKIDIIGMDKQYRLDRSLADNLKEFQPYYNTSHYVASSSTEDKSTVLADIFKDIEEDYQTNIVRSIFLGEDDISRNVFSLRDNIEGVFENIEWSGGLNSDNILRCQKDDILFTVGNPNAIKKEILLKEFSGENVAGLVDGIPLSYAKRETFDDSLTFNLLKTSYLNENKVTLMNLYLNAKGDTNSAKVEFIVDLLQKNVTDVSSGALLIDFMKTNKNMERILDAIDRVTKNSDYKIDPQTDIFDIYQEDGKILISSDKITVPEKMLNSVEIPDITSQFCKDFNVSKEQQEALIKKSENKFDI